MVTSPSVFSLIYAFHVLQATAFFKNACVHTCLYARVCDLSRSLRIWCSFETAAQREKKISPGIVRQLDEVMGSSQRKDGAIRKAFELLCCGDAQIILEGNQDYIFFFF